MAAHLSIQLQSETALLISDSVTEATATIWHYKYMLHYIQL